MNRYALCVVNFQAALAETSPHLLVVRSTKVPAASISASKDLELVVRAGEGVDNSDLAAAAIAKVKVANRGVPMPMLWLSLRWGSFSAHCCARYSVQTIFVGQGLVWRWQVKGP